MAETEGGKPSKSATESSPEKKIPVFTVLKNDAVLKNIFLLDRPPSLCDPNTRPEQESEEILVIGRHPNCSITLEHPSISRFHLRLHSKPSSLQLSVVDLSSVHGTWVLGVKIEPGVLVELNEGDTVRLGGSSRIYRLHWVPLSCAYDLDDPFVPPTDHLMQLKDREEGNKDENSLCVETNQIQSPCNDLEGLEFLFSQEMMKSSKKKVSPSGSPIPEFGTSYRDEVNEENRSTSKENHNQNESSGISSGALLKESYLETENQQSDETNEMPQALGLVGVLSERENAESPTTNLDPNRNLLDCFYSSFSEEEVEKLCSPKEEHEHGEISSLDCHQIASIATLGSEEQSYFDKESHSLQPIVGPGVPAGKDLDNTPGKSNEGGSFFGEIPEVVDDQNSLKSDHELNQMLGLWYNALGMESVNSSLPGESIPTEIGIEQLENNMLQSFNCLVSPTKDTDFPAIKSKQIPEPLSIFSERRKPASVQVQNGNCKGAGIGVITDAEIELPNKENLENESEEEIFTPDKENVTPTTRLLRSMMKTDIVEKIKHSTPHRLSPLRNSVGCNIDIEKGTLVSSDKENQTPVVLQERKLLRPASMNLPRLEPEVTAIKSRLKRAPFQSLLANSNSKSNSKARVLGFNLGSGKSFNDAQTEEKSTVVGDHKRWIMVVDSNCLVSKESRKALQLLEGLKGTQLFIPRTVIRELECLKQRGSLFRRTTDVSSALQWIEDCKVSTNWWIHVQSLVEEVRHLAPTPPASPLSTTQEESVGFSFSSTLVSAFGNLLETVSPTAEDDILEYALLLRSIKNDEQFVFLSDDVSLKIKAMAHGMICEAAVEFRESLVNPFSERFLWAESSPRGLTWSCVDDVVLRENYYSGPFKKPSKSGQGLKGLKLILLYSSQYRQISSVK